MMKKIRKLIISLIQIAAVLMVNAVIEVIAANSEKKHYEAALQAYNQGNIEIAYIHLKKALQQSERNLPAKLLLAKVLIDKNSYPAAEQELNDLLAQGVDNNCDLPVSHLANLFVHNVNLLTYYANL
ncbi:MULTISPECIES: tetratricopeptide repeat protein [unclassified Colwellia]|jgi:thioredoxin-like negative regulator of GroEL|uniref:tetratricopeptide repeat protein n=1 Tax=unclassified Colwellia TaxID=196834 RepID=UPI0015F3AA98|nr:MULTISPECIES: tetratricopeptide repeat protein [unclassified Colwellia]MBA6250852.1 tetratricopeptide repeat protein [Colwellia sp. MB3u-55]MBA6399483.1 tetratricopeptide repeat protein [Colwellia sp. BRX10-4]